MLQNQHTKNREFWKEKNPPISCGFNPDEYWNGDETHAEEIAAWMVFLLALYCSQHLHGPCKKLYSITCNIFHQNGCDYHLSRVGYNCYNRRLIPNDGKNGKAYIVVFFIFFSFDDSSASDMTHEISYSFW